MTRKSEVMMDLIYRRQFRCRVSKNLSAGCGADIRWQSALGAAG